MENLVLSGQSLGRFILGFVILSFWGYYIVKNVRKIKGSKIKW